MSIYLGNLKSSRTGIIAWSALIALYGLFVMYLYPSLKNAPGLMQYYQSLPEPLRQALGLSGQTDPESILSLRFFVSSEFFAWAPLFIAVYAVFAGGNAIAKEVELGTADLLLSLPLTRARLLLSKFGAILSAMAVILLGALAGLVAGMQLIADRTSVGGMALALAHAAPLLLAVAGYSLLFSCLFLVPRRALAISGIVTVSMYILNFMSPSLGSYQWVKRLSIFHYYRPHEIISKEVFEWGSTAVLLGLTLACLVAALLVFRRRDIST